jgi:uncharacterized Tic20 family protein
MTEPKPGDDAAPDSTDPTANAGPPAEPYSGAPTADPTGESSWSSTGPAVPPGPPEPPAAPSAWPSPPGDVAPPPPPPPPGYPGGRPPDDVPPPGYAGGPPPGYPPPGYGSPGYPPYAPPPPPGAYSLQAPWRAGPDDTTWALLGHLSYFVLGIIGPLVIMLTKGKESGFVRDQAVEVLNFHITLAILSVVCVALFFLIIPLIVLAVAYVAGAVFAIIGAVTASRGEAYRYPLNIRLVK